jgi:hypothetical protein
MCIESVKGQKFPYWEEYTSGHIQSGSENADTFYALIICERNMEEQIL